jgi:hypothetical protein
MIRAFLLVAAAATAAPVNSPGDRAAVLIRQVAPEVPVEAAGTGLAPLVKLAAVVDIHGKLTGIEVLEIRPSSDLDPYFEKAIRQALAWWRYAPAIKNGSPAETKLNWTVQFVPKASDSVGGPAVPAGTPTVVGTAETASGVERWSRYLSGLQSDEIRKLRDRQLATAEGLLEKKTRREASTDRFIVVTDASRPDVAEKIAHNLEATYGTVYKLLSPTVTPQPTHDKVVTYVFASQASYRSFARNLEVWDFAEGFYSPLGLMAFTLEVTANEELTSLMLHETVHAFLHQHVIRPGVSIPTWLNEGFADYVGNSDVKEGKIVPGSHKPFTLYHAPAVAWSNRSISKLGADEVKAALKKGKAITVKDLLSAQPDVFYGDKHELYYSQAWLLVHFLNNGGPDWNKERFPRFMLFAAEGFPVDAALKTVYGLSGDPLEAAYRAYVAKF